MSNIVIDIAAEFTGKPAFKKAETSTDRLSNSTKKLAKSLLAVYRTQKVLAYAKNSIKAAAADEKAQIQLANALKNVGMERDAIGAEGYIQRLQKEFGILDDELRPAYQTLAIATKDAATTQKVLGVALDISAATGKDLNSVTAALSKAYLGNNTALSKLGVGISKADLKTKSFEEVVDQLGTTFAGSAKKSADSFQGSMNKLTVASTNASEIIGTGLIDALKMLGDDNSVSTLAQDMEDVALYIGDAIRGVGVLVEKLKSIPGAGVLFDAFKVFQKTSALGVLNTLGQASRTAPKPFSTGMSISGQSQVATQTKLTKLTQQQASAQSKILRDKKLQAAIDKANLSLNKGQDIFDMDKIQIAAALTSQAEQLGKATSSAQQMQILNDVARLNVKKSILALEDAIAAKDEAAIIAATNKLNEDLKVLSALNGQKVTLTSIESILAGLKPKELIDQENLNEALRKIQQMLDLLAEANAQSKAKVPSSSTLGTGIPVNDYIEPISKEIAAKGSIAAILEYADAASARANAFADLLDMDTAAKTQALQSSPLYDNSGALQSFRQSESAAMGNTIIVNTGVGDPNAIAEAIDQVLQEAVQRGTLRGGLYAV